MSPAFLIKVGREMGRRTVFTTNHSVRKLMCDMSYRCRCPTRVSPQAGINPILARGAACEEAALRPATTPPRLPTRTTGNSNSNSRSSRPQEGSSNNRLRCSARANRVASAGAAVAAARGELLSYSRLDARD